MRDFSFQQKAVLLISIVFAATAANGQDLGSSNKLFGGGKSTSTKKSPAATAPSKTSPKKATAVKPVVRAKAAVAKTRVQPRRPVAVARKPAVKEKAVIAPRNPKTVEPDTKSSVQSSIATTRKVAATSPAVEAQFERLIDRGNDARDDRNYPAAEAAYASAKELKPVDPRSYLGLGNVYADQQRWEDAEKAYRSSIEYDDARAGSLVSLSYVLARPVAAPNLSERYQEAENLARKTLKLEPQNPLANDQLGVALELRGEIGSETEAAYRRSIQIAPKFALAYAHLGRLLRKKGKTAESALAYSNAMTRSNDIATKILVAEVLQSEGRINESIQLLDQAVNGDPRNPTALTLLGRALTTQGKFADAERTLKRSIEVSPASFIGYSLLGSLYSRQGKFEAADYALVKSIRFVTPFEKRRLATQFEAVGDGYAKAGRPKSASRAYRQALSLDPERETLAGKLAKFN